MKTYFTLIFTGISFLFIACTTNLENPEHMKSEFSEGVDGYTYCGDEETCQGPAKRSGEIWCQNQSGCSQMTDCDCRLFKDDKREEGRDWKHDADANQKRDYDDNYAYACWCTKQ